MQHLNLRNPHGIKNKKRNHFQRRQLNELHFFPKHPRINNQDQDPPSRSSKFQTRNPEPRDRSDSRKLPSRGSERGDTHPPIYPPRHHQESVLASQHLALQRWIGKTEEERNRNLLEPKRSHECCFGGFAHSSALILVPSMNVPRPRERANTCINGGV